MTRIQEIPWVEEVIENRLENHSDRGDQKPWRLDLYHLPWIRPWLESRWPQLVLRITTFSGLLFAIAVGLFGTGVGSHNFAIIFIWIAWWTALKLAFIPFGGRSWCSLCPIPLPGDWLQQRGILNTGKRRFGLNVRWPKHLRGSWLQSGGFLLIGLFSAVTLTDPRVTSGILLGLMLLAIVMSITFEHRAFCTNLCPVGGFSGMYAQTSPVELRVIDKETCANHKDKSCYHACPWGLYPLAFRDSAACGLCLECLRACPQDNLALSLRPFGSDLGRPKNSSRLDEAFLALVMLGSVLSFSAVFTGPWGWLKSAAFKIGSLPWANYAAGYLLLNLVLLPALFIFVVWAGQKFTKDLPMFRHQIATQAQSLFPLGLMAWIAFTVSFALPKFSLILGVLNDPFGWGWHWLGTFTSSQAMSTSSFNLVIQVVLLAIGLYWSAMLTHKLSTGKSKPVTITAVPVQAFSLIFTIIMLWILVG